MNVQKPIKVVDLFAGPGGLGEGFSSLNSGREFEIKVSAEMEVSARSTLRLRAFYRFLKKNDSKLLEDYYYFCETNGAVEPYTKRSLEAWRHADSEALLLELGTEKGNLQLDKVLSDINGDQPWVLIGGPPCQAYSIVGRARNRGNLDYRAENDKRHFLYREYLRVLQRKKPAIFVMENVKGILSSTVDGEKIFPKILQDLSAPDLALGEADSGHRYRICSLVSDNVYTFGLDIDTIDLNGFVIKSENFGVPQARHRVILLGVSEDLFPLVVDHKIKTSDPISVSQAIGSLPPLRSTLTRVKDTPAAWAEIVRSHLGDFYNQLNVSSADLGRKELLMRELFKITASCFDDGGLTPGGLRYRKDSKWSGKTNTVLDSWYLDDKLRHWLNHEARGHMGSDLGRYAYAAIFSRIHERSPKGHKEFYLKGLAPDHKNWETGKFSDRFRVQLSGLPSTTITSHIAKDGHYFIHYDVHQCRSLTVREAARLQTFPDNYFFLGNRTEQFHQVGNAVPPLLAFKIAEVVAKIINTSGVRK